MLDFEGMQIEMHIYCVYIILYYMHIYCCISDITKYL